MKVYALMYVSSKDKIVFPAGGRSVEDSVEFTPEPFQTHIRMFPESWMIYELELDEKELCDI